MRTHLAIKDSAEAVQGSRRDPAPTEGQQLGLPLLTQHCAHTSWPQDRSALFTLGSELKNSHSQVLSGKGSGNCYEPSRHVEAPMYFASFGCCLFVLITFTINVCAYVCTHMCMHVGIKG